MPEQTNEQESSFADAVEGLDLSNIAAEPMNIIDETSDEQYPCPERTADPNTQAERAMELHTGYMNDLTTIKSHPDFPAYKAGYLKAVMEIMAKISEVARDDDMIAIHFNDLHTDALEQERVHKMVGDVQHFVDAVEELPEGSDVQLERVPTDAEAVAGRILEQVPTDAEMAAAVPVAGQQDFTASDDELIHAGIARDTQIAGNSLEQLEVEKVLREQATEIERLTQQVQRDDEAVALWSHMADYFNRKLAGQPEASMNIALFQRIKAYVQRLEDYDGMLPPSLAGFLVDQPEAERELTPVAQLALYIQRLQAERDAAEAGRKQANADF